MDAHFIGSNDLVEKTDFAPTILDYAGISVPPDMQGKSLMPLLRGVEREDWRTAIYCHHWQHLLHSQLMAHYGIRTKKHKLIFFYGLPLGLKDYSPTAPEWELFDLMADPREMENMYHRDENSKLRDSLKL
ncbi:MAG: DUF4976 domain-containing protein [Saprospiraceae bacterium]|nr:DUF4976 domain-containing protein [Saprospiraceae bacterium]